GGRRAPPSPSSRSAPGRRRARARACDERAVAQPFDPAAPRTRDSVLHDAEQTAAGPAIAGSSASGALREVGRDHRSTVPAVHGFVRIVATDGPGFDRLTPRG